MKEKCILVPTDFSKVGDTAIDHAVSVARKIGAEIYILHIVDNKKGLSEAKMRLQEVADEASYNGNPWVEGSTILNRKQGPENSYRFFHTIYYRTGKGH